MADNTDYVLPEGCTCQIVYGGAHDGGPNMRFNAACPVHHPHNAERVAAFLREIVGDSTPEELAREVERWADSGDFNESWIATIRQQASELLRLIDGEDA